MIDRRRMQMRYLAVTKMQQFARCIILRRNFLLRVARMTHARQVIQRAVQVYMFKRRVTKAAYFNAQLRMHDIAQARSFLGMYNYDDSLVMPIYHHRASQSFRPSLSSNLTDVERTGGTGQHFALSATEIRWRQAYARTQQLSAVATDVAWQSMKSLISSADSSACYRSTVPLVGFADSPTCYRSHSAGDSLAMHEPVFLGLELGMPATEVKHRQHLEYYFELNSTCTAPARRSLYEPRTVNSNRNHFNWFSDDQLGVQLILSRFGKLNTVKMSESVPHEFVYGMIFHDRADSWVDISFTRTLILMECPLDLETGQSTQVRLQFICRADTMEVGRCGSTAY